MAVRETRVIDGRAEAAALREKVAAKISSASRPPHLWVILVGDDSASQIYVQNKMRVAEKTGLRASLSEFASTLSQQELEDEIAKRNEDDDVDGILLQLPLPKNLETHRALSLIAPMKDVDGLNPLNAGRLFQRGHRDDVLAPCTPLGCIHLAKSVLPSLEGQRALVIGRSELVGKPLAALLLSENCTVTMAHSRTRNLKEEIARADLLFAALGKPLFVKGQWIKEGATVIDVGINPMMKEGKRRLVGDVAYEESLGRAHAITPVPGGVGPMTVAYLLDNSYKAALAAGKI